MFLLGPGLWFKIVLRSDTGYFKYLSMTYFPSTRSRPCTLALTLFSYSGVSTQNKEENKCVCKYALVANGYRTRSTCSGTKCEHGLGCYNRLVGSHDLFGQEGCVLSHFGQSRDHDRRYQPPVVQRMSGWCLPDS